MFIISINNYTIYFKTMYKLKKIPNTIMKNISFKAVDYPHAFLEH